MSVPVPHDDGPEIFVLPQGNIANRLIQYLGALRIVDRLGRGRIANVSVPEWALELPARHDPVPDEACYDINRTSDYDLDLIADGVASGRIRRIVIRDYLQSIDCLGDPSFGRARLPFAGRSYIDQPPGTIVINIRAAELLDGIEHYPLVPVEFYRDIVRRTGLEPIFMGQVDQGEYGARLRAEFPTPPSIRAAAGSTISPPCGPPAGSSSGSARSPGWPAGSRRRTKSSCR